MRAHDHKTKAELAAEAIRAAVVDGRFGPGEPFNVVHVARELGMSATPVREALRALQSDGLFQQTPYRRSSIAAITLDDLEEVYRLRIFLEPLATSLAAGRLRQDTLSELVAQNHAMLLCSEAGDYAELRQLNYHWHLRIYDSAQTRFIADFIRRLWTAYSWDDVWTVAGTTALSVQQHDAILEALRAGDGSGAAQLMRGHIEAGFERAKESRNAPDGRVS